MDADTDIIFHLQEKNELPPTYGEKLYKRYNSFMERFDALEEVLKVSFTVGAVFVEIFTDLVHKSKLVCKNVVMGQERLFRVAWNTEAEIRASVKKNHSFKLGAAAIVVRDKHGAFPETSHLINKADNVRKRFRI